MPKDLEVIGIYRASQHTPSPDLFIPLVIGCLLYTSVFIVREGTYA